MCRYALLAAVAAGLVLGSPGRSRAAEYYVAADGKAQNPGTMAAPWDLASAFGGAHPVRPGDTLWVRGGTYKHPNRKPGAQGFSLTLKGAKDQPIHIRPYRDERATLDGGLRVNASYVWVWGLEILVSENLGQPRSHPTDLNRPWGSLNVTGGRGCKFLNLVIHDNAQGIGLWRSVAEAEVHGCLIYHNGWKGPDRMHGPAIYTQNLPESQKRITDNLLFQNYSYALQAYGSSTTWVDNYLIEGNAAFSPKYPGKRNMFHVGGGKPSHDIIVRDNILHGYSLRLGTQRKGNERATVTGNRIFRGRYTKAPWTDLTEKDNRVWNEGDPVPEAPLIVLRPNRYDANRANLVIVDLAKTRPLKVDLAPFVKPGERFRLLAAWNFFGQPVAEGTYEGPIEIAIPATPATSNGEVGAYVVLKVPPPAD